MSDGGYTGAIDVWALGASPAQLLQRQQQHALTPHLTVSPLFRFDDDPVSEPDSGETYTKWMSNGVANGDGDGDGDGDVDMRDATSRRERPGEGSLNLFFDAVGTPLVARRPRGVERALARVPPRHSRSTRKSHASVRGVRRRESRSAASHAHVRLGTTRDARRNFGARVFPRGRGRPPKCRTGCRPESRRDRGLGPRVHGRRRAVMGDGSAGARRWRRSRRSSPPPPPRETAFAPAAATAARGARVSEELFRRECDRSTRSGAKDESPPPPASPTSFARWESAFDHPSGEDVSARSTLVEQRDLPGRLHDVFPLFFAARSDRWRMTGGPERVRAERAGRPRGHRVAVPRRRSGHDWGVRPGRGWRERAPLRSTGRSRASSRELSFGEWGTGDAAAARMNEDEMGDRLGRSGTSAKIDTGSGGAGPADGAKTRRDVRGGGGHGRERRVGGHGGATGDVQTGGGSVPERQQSTRSLTPRFPEERRRRAVTLWK